MMSGLTFSLLGPFRGEAEQRSLSLGPARQQAMLAMLVLRAGEVLTSSEIVAGVWGEQAPASGERLIPTYIYRLRGALKLRDSGLAETSLIRASGGYVLNADVVRTDLQVFERQVAEAESVRRSGRLQAAAEVLAESLEIWRGEPLVGLPGPFMCEQRRRLDELRLNVRRERLEWELELGRHVEAVPELFKLFAAESTREDIARLLMLALHRAGRRSEALEVFSRLRSTMVEHLGIEPSADMQRLQDDVLHADIPSDVDAFPAAQSSQASYEALTLERRAAQLWHTRTDLPALLGPFVGRRAELERAAAELTAPRHDGIGLHVVDGMPGVGKTAFTLRLAAAIAKHFPDGQLHVLLRSAEAGHGTVQPAAALATLLRAVGISEQDIPDSLDDRSSLWRACTAERGILLMLDDAADVAQVRPLLPGGVSSTVLVTSRRRLAGLQPTGRTYVELLPPDEAKLLLAELTGYPTDSSLSEPEEFDRIVEGCGGLALALTIAAAVLRNRPSWTPEHLATKLEPGQGKWVGVRVDDLSVASAFARSYHELDASQRMVFRCFGAPGSAEMDAATVALHCAMTEEQARDSLEELLHANLVQETDPECFRMPVLLRDYARELTD